MNLPGFEGLIVQLEAKFKVDADSGSDWERKQAVRWLEKIEKAEREEMTEKDKRAQEKLEHEMQIQEVLRETREVERSYAQAAEQVTTDLAAEQKRSQRFERDVEALKGLVDQRTEMLKDAELKLETQSAEIADRAWFVQQLVSMGGRRRGRTGGKQVYGVEQEGARGREGRRRAEAAAGGCRARARARAAGRKSPRAAATATGAAGLCGRGGEKWAAVAPRGEAADGGGGEAARAGVGGARRGEGATRNGRRTTGRRGGAQRRNRPPIPRTLAGPSTRGHSPPPTFD